MLKSEHVAATHKTGLEALAELTSAALNSVEKLSELQFQTVRASLEDTAEQGMRAFDARSLHELTALQGEASQPAEKLVAYGRHLYQIAAGTHAEWRKVAQTRANEQCRIALAWVDDYAKQAVPGSEPAVSFMRSTITAAQRACDAWQDASTHAIHLMDNALQTSGKTTKKTSA
ncbi:phasin family protein [Ralstonia solanacearum]|uniref:phasin family protein n=1 Tax=Ralstonia solanacearum TaxID=305 RepID=UPI00078B4B9C|nr:phasin family protein [Ralstonia solanacearum]AMP38987.1 granule-associated protein [Ralstonia solanacearum]AXV87814.1 granule-associated protein [Ralstonia solanacearum]AXW07272.1 granule-associated protein [Ralstonia solanacearum]AXW25055.1 granule-associated protein [Ralstonia solanacearum]AXW81968.1 granule-associated protein [Ralstonia solanacearum]